MKNGLNRNQIKYIAIIAMIIDHIAYFFIPSTNLSHSIFRVIGKLTAPIMCYFLVEGYYYTSSKTRYGMRLFIFSIISQFSFSLAFFNNLFTFRFNMIFTLWICFLILLCYEKIKNRLIRLVIISCLVIFSDFCDWGIFAPLCVIIFHIFRGNTFKQVVSFFIVTIFHIITQYIIITNYSWNLLLIQLGLLLFIPVLFFYNGQKGNSNKFNKWFFYIFYPVHLLLIYLV